MSYSEEDYLQLSGIQHFTFCRRQWALIHIEDSWHENWLTIEGRQMHERAHDPYATEKRGDMIITRDMPVFSRLMGVSGKCDVVEFHQDESGVELHGRRGKWLPIPVEYKHGHTKTTNEDRFQLTAQAMCLEEMLLCKEIEAGFMYYGETRRREPVAITQELREGVKSMYEEMHAYFKRQYTPRVKQTKACKSCSLVDVCIPKMPAEKSVASYIREYITTESEAST